MVNPGVEAQGTKNNTSDRTAGSNQPYGLVVDSLSLPIGQSPGFSEDRQLCHYLPGDSLTCEQAASGLSGKAIGQRNCTVDRPDVSANPHPGDRQDTLHQQESESQTNDDDSSWQVVIRRRSRRQRPLGTTGKRDEQNGGQAKAASASRLPKNSSAGNRVSGQKQPLCRNDQVGAISMTSSAYWPVCTDSFVRLGGMNWSAFHTLMVSSRARYKTWRARVCLLGWCLPFCY